MTWKKEDVHCRFGDLFKTSALNKHQHELVFGAFPPDKLLGVVRYLTQYVSKTKALRGV